MNTQRDTLAFGLFLLGLRGPRTAVSTAETELLRELAESKRSIVEVGVYEGATSRKLCSVMCPEGLIYLVDCYRPGVRLERWLDTSFARHVATRMVKPWRRQVRFVRMDSASAAAAELLEQPADFVFIDADHSYEAVREDFLAWSAQLDEGGTLALHDSRPCPARGDLTPATGPVRLAGEIRDGRFGAWEVVATADSVTAFRRASGGREA